MRFLLLILRERIEPYIEKFFVPDQFEPAHSLFFEAFTPNLLVKWTQLENDSKSLSEAKMECENLKTKCVAFEAEIASLKLKLEDFEKITIERNNLLTENGNLKE